MGQQVLLYWDFLEIVEVDTNFGLMRQIGIYSLRILGTIILSCLIGSVLAWLVRLVFVSVMLLIPALLHTMFDFSFSDVLKNSVIGQVTGLGQWVAVVNGKDFPVRLAMLVVTIVTIIALGIIAYMSHWLTKIIKGRKVLSFIAMFPFLLWLLSLIADFYLTDSMATSDIDKGFWYYAVSGILILVALLIMFMIIACCWAKQEGKGKS